MERFKRLYISIGVAVLLVLIFSLFLAFFNPLSHPNFIEPSKESSMQSSSSTPSEGKSTIPTSLHTFSCEGVKGFTFQFPEASLWEVGKTIYKPNSMSKGYSTCTVVLEGKSDVGGKNPSILVTIQDESAQGGTIATSSLPVNANGVFYSYSKEDMVGELKHYGYVQFISKNKVYWVALDGVTNAMGFPTEQFFKTVIDSFAVME